MANEQPPRYDKLGRRIPDFNRSEAGKKAAETAKKLYGEEHHRNLAKERGKVKNPNKGFGTMSKADPERHRQISKEGGKHNRRDSSPQDQPQTDSTQKGRLQSPSLEGV